MRRLIPILIYSAMAADLVAGEPVDSLPSQVRQLALEVKTLRLELYRVTLRQISAESAPWQRELQSVQSRIARLAEEEQTARQSSQALQQQLTESGLSPEERREIRQLDAGPEMGGGAMAAERQKLQNREAEIVRYLQAQNQAWNAAASAAAKLEAEFQASSPGAR